MKKIPKANKFSVLWQIKRTKARDIKDPAKKILYVMNFLEENPNIHNLSRVHNWLSMTKVAYKDPEIRAQFDEQIEYIENNIEKFSSTEDNKQTLQDTKDEDLKLVYADLSKRKYGFQYKNVPKDHVEFMDKLEAEMKKRKLI